MPATIIDGNAVAEAIRAELKQDVDALKARGVTPGLAVLLIGDDPASASYVRGKERAAGQVGIYSETIRLPRDVSQDEVLGRIRELNEANHWHAILVQLPAGGLPPQLNEREVLEAVHPEKDADGLHSSNMGRLLQGEPGPVPCTPAGVQELLVRSGNDPGGRHVVICGRSNLVGKPLAALLVQKRTGANATVTICHTGTRDLPGITRQADILIAAMGRPNAITADMVRDGAVVIDVGINRVEDPATRTGYRLTGDVDFRAVAGKASAITPVPGGVGPMTVAMLLTNTVRAARRLSGMASEG